MIKKEKRINKVLISFLINIGFFSFCFGAIGDVYKSCTEPTITEYFPVGDTTGKSVLTKKEEVRECNVTKVVQGKCIKWEEYNDSVAVPKDRYSVFESKDYSSTLGNLFSAISAYNQINHLWSGWHGYCEHGTKSDFSWAEDPMFWSSLMLSAVLTAAGGSESTSEVGKKGAEQGAESAAKTTSQNIASQAAEETAKTTGGWLESLGIPSITAGANDAQAAAGAAYLEEVKRTGQQYSEEVLQNVMKKAVEEYYKRIGLCLMTGAYNFAVSTYQFYNEMSKSEVNIPCDPVDEVCNENDNNQIQDETIYTIDETQFNDMVDDFNSQGENIYDYIEIVQPSPDNGIVKYKFKSFNQIENITNNMNTDEIEALKRKVETMKYAINLASNVSGMASCLGGYSGPSVQIPTDSGTDRTKEAIRSTVNQAVDFAASFAPQPYGAIIGAGVKILTYTTTSFSNVNSCTNEKDAKNSQDPRQIQTRISLKYNLCHLVKEECVDTNFIDEVFGKDCSLYGRFYCCYDGILTKILVEQLKAELGRDWAHCTGITLRDLNYVSFRQCSESEMRDGIDGAHQVGDYNPQDAFQYKHKCIDLSEYLNYLNKNMNLDISPQDFKEYWNSITNDTTNIN